jgi:hypothetical protein
MTERKARAKAKAKRALEVKLRVFTPPMTMEPS